MDNTNNQIYGNMNIHQCEICDKDFKTKSGLQNHFSTIHCEQKENKCNICHKLFHFPCKLASHIKSVHENKKNHNCDSCGKSFSSAQDTHKFNS